eukprot:6186433-Pleurochrysis_carterae.AAC.2
MDFEGSARKSKTNEHEKTGSRKHTTVSAAACSTSVASLTKLLARPAPHLRTHRLQQYTLLHGHKTHSCEWAGLT